MLALEWTSDLAGCRYRDLVLWCILRATFSGLRGTNQQKQEGCEIRNSSFQLSSSPA